ncbi:MAG: BolA/IbaG family iron-sulfur metabolism protein [Myxococcales bacterium]|jgi:acid stress-induced BolA-like protein IbaG/YrbA|nr:BolA/IbaG family iron-sulfur metabolism protein [Myxococcales bacterium]MBL9109425.1 BolA/IbaG family iron-sulfur metabolism protein [Myxococcales bacterium]
MSDHPTDFQGDILEALRTSITGALPDAAVEAQGGNGHYTLVVTSKAFAGKGPVEAQRLVYSAIAHLMKGDRAPVHAVDSLKTRVPS